MTNSITGALARKRSELGQKEKGFTLIELLVVVIIIGILAAIAIPIFMGQQDSAKDGGVKSDLATAKIAVVSFYTDNSTGAPTFTAGGTAEDYGFGLSDNTTSVTFSGTAPAKTGDPFCLVGVSTSSGTPSFNITDSKGVGRGAVCGVDTP